MANEYWEDKGSKNYWEETKAAKVGAIDSASGLSQFMMQTYTWMSMGLAITGLIAFLTANTPVIRDFIFGTPFVFFGLIIAELGLVFAFGSALRRGASTQALLAMFVSYAAVNGLTLSVIFMVYTTASITQSFFIASAMFGGMSLYGYVTKKDLTGIGQFAIMGVWGLIVALVVNMFLRSTILDLCVSLIGVGIFTILTAYDTQKIKAYYYSVSHEGDGLKRASLGGALTLYLDFINLFLYLLRLFGKRR